LFDTLDWETLLDSVVDQLLTSAKGEFHRVITVEVDGGFPKRKEGSMVS